MDASLRELVRQRANDRCEYCHIRQTHLPVERLWIEHVLPKQHGGEDDLSNLAMSCARCNRHRGPNLAAVDPDTSEIVQVFDPRRQTWEEHFVYRGAVIVGLTPTGRATVRLLDVNAEKRVRLRAALLANNELD
jgi:hypothetical protein